MPDISYPYDDRLVVELGIANHLIRKVLMDTGSSVDILFYDAFEKMGFKHSYLKPIRTPLIGFFRKREMVEGIISLSVIMETTPCLKLMVNFTVVKVPSAYNAILGRLTLGVSKAVYSPYYLKVKFPTPNEVGQLLGDQSAAHDCYGHTLKAKETFSLEDLDQMDEVRQ